MCAGIKNPVCAKYEIKVCVEIELSRLLCEKGITMHIHLIRIVLWFQKRPQVKENLSSVEKMEKQNIQIKRFFTKFAIFQIYTHGKGFHP